MQGKFPKLATLRTTTSSSPIPFATLEIPTLAYGIRYELGIFRQEIVDGWQVERTDKWLTFGNPWEIARPEWAAAVKLGGHTERYV